MSSKSQSEKYGAPWVREELILAFDLYCRIPFKKTKANNPDVIELARILQRTPASVARKLGNIGSFDPELQNRQVSGLSHASKLDKAIWNEFQSDWNRLVLEAKRLREKSGVDSGSAGEDAATLERPQGASEKEVLRKSRIHQAFFREAVLSSYEESCCVTGLKIGECLVASHIVPWSVAEEFRTDPRNGLCLSATFDRLFDRGLITLSDSLDVVVASVLRQSNDKRTHDMVSRYHGAPMIRPRRFLATPRSLRLASHKYLPWIRQELGGEIVCRMESVSSLVAEYRVMFERHALGSTGSIEGPLTQEADWNPQAAEHLIRLAKSYGSFMLRNALAISLALDIEDGELGF